MISVCDVGPRDGLQNEQRVLPAAVRAGLVNRLAGAGVERVEAVSFVNPERVPAMAGAEDVVAGIERRPGTTYAGLVLNERGYERLAACQLDEAHFAFAVTETFNRRNQNASVAESISVARRVIELAHRDGRRATVTIGASFGCPFEGRVDPERVLKAAEDLASAGADEIVFADTIGVGVPRQVRELVTGAASLGTTIGLHLHNTRNTGYVNAYMGLEYGVRALDASVGGLGGCPFAPRATGNIATEDLVYMIEGQGVDTGIDLDALVEVAVWLEEIMEKQLPGQVHRAGLFRPVPTRSHDLQEA